MCSCDIDAESPAVFHAVVRRARVEHSCCECGRALEPGERYQHVSGVWDGAWDHYRTCERCVRDRAAFSQRSEDHCTPAFGTLHECLEEEYEEEDHRHLSGTPVAWFTSFDAMGSP